MSRRGVVPTAGPSGPDHFWRWLLGVLLIMLAIVVPITLLMNSVR